MSKEWCVSVMTAAAYTLWHGACSPGRTPKVVPLLRMPTTFTYTTRSHTRRFLWPISVRVRMNPEVLSTLRTARVAKAMKVCGGEKTHAKHKQLQPMDRGWYSHRTAN